MDVLDSFQRIEFKYFAAQWQNGVTCSYPQGKKIAKNKKITTTTNYHGTHGRKNISYFCFSRPVQGADSDGGIEHLLKLQDLLYGPKQTLHVRL